MTGLTRGSGKVKFDVIKFCNRCGEAVALVSKDRKRCPSCDQWYFPNPVPVVLVVAYNAADEVILTRKNEWPDDAWGLIAGFVECGETAEETAVREAQEECNVQVQVARIVGTYPHPRLEDQLIIGVLARIVGGELRAGDDADQVAFFRFSTAPIPQHWTARRVFEDALVVLESGRPRPQEK